MKLSDLENTLRREYDSRQISPSVRGMVLEYLGRYPTVRGEDLISIKVFTKVAANAYLHDRTGFDRSLVDRLLTYHDEGIEAGREKYCKTQAEKFHTLYIHLASHAVELINKSVLFDKEMPKSTKERVLRRGLDLVELIQTEAKEKDSDQVITATTDGAYLAFHLYTETNDLRYAEQGYHALEKVCAAGGIGPQGYSFAINKRSILTSRVSQRVSIDGERKDIILWAKRAYEAADDDLPFPTTELVHRLYSRAKAAEMLYKATQNQTWKKRALRGYYRLMDYRKEHPDEQFSADADRYARWFITRESRK